MKRNIRYLTVPLHIWEHGDLTLQEKHVLIDIDSLCSSEGIAIGPQSLATMSGIPVKEIKEILASLYQKGALEINLDENGAKILKPLIWKERYVRQEEKVIIGDSPKDKESIDYLAIQEAWNTTCTELPKLNRFTTHRKQKTRTCLKGASATEADMIKVIKLVSTSSFLNGKKKDWRCTYDWIIKSPDNFTKIIEGQYHKDYIERLYYEGIMYNQTVDINKKEDDNYYR